MEQNQITLPEVRHTISTALRLAENQVDVLHRTIEGQGQRIAELEAQLEKAKAPAKKEA